MAVTGIINLSKGEKINLTKEVPGLTKIMVGLGWEPNDNASKYPFDLDASAYLVHEDGKTYPDGFVFYNNLKGPFDCVVHMGDNLDGNSDEEDSDDEQIMIDLDLVPDSIKKIAIAVTIHKADERRQNYGMINNSYCRIINIESGDEVARFDLGEDFSIETSVVIGELYRHYGEWKFSAIGKGLKGGLVAVCAKYGIEAEYM